MSDDNWPDSDQYKKAHAMFDAHNIPVTKRRNDNGTESFILTFDDKDKADDFRHLLQLKGLDAPLQEQRGRAQSFEDRGKDNGNNTLSLRAFGVYARLNDFDKFFDENKNAVEKAIPAARNTRIMEETKSGGIQYNYNIAVMVGNQLDANVLPGSQRDGRGRLELNFPDDEKADEFKKELEKVVGKENAPRLGVRLESQDIGDHKVSFEAAPFLSSSDPIKQAFDKNVNVKDKKYSSLYNKISKEMHDAHTSTAEIHDDITAVKGDLKGLKKTYDDARMYSGKKKDFANDYEDTLTKYADVRQKLNPNKEARPPVDYERGLQADYKQANGVSKAKPVSDLYHQIRPQNGREDGIYKASDTKYGRVNQNLEEMARKEHEAAAEAARERKAGKNYRFPDADLSQFRPRSPNPADEVKRANQEENRLIGSMQTWMSHVVAYPDDAQGMKGFNNAYSAARTHFMSLNKSGYNDKWDAGESDAFRLAFDRYEGKERAWEDAKTLYNKVLEKARENLTKPGASQQLIDESKRALDADGDGRLDNEMAMRATLSKQGMPDKDIDGKLAALNKEMELLKGAGISGTQVASLPEGRQATKTVPQDPNKYIV